MPPREEGRAAPRAGRWLLIIAALAVAAPAGLGCRGVTVKPLGPDTFPSHDKEVCILEGARPPDLEYVPVADVTVELNSYGGDKRAKAGLAKQARKLGADAVITATFTNLLGAPSGSGRAVRLKEGVRPPAACEWY